MAAAPFIVIAEDDQEICTLLCTFLEQDCYRVATANEYSLGCAIVQNTDVDLLITDVRLPGGSGERLAELARAKGIAVLLISGEPETIRRLKAEHIPFLQKPFRLSALKKEIEKILPKHNTKLNMVL